MTYMKWRLPFGKRGRRRAARGRENPSAVFKTFVHVLAQMHAHARPTGHPNLAATEEKG